MRKFRRERRPQRFFMFFVFGAAIFLLVSLLVMFLWNAVLPALLGLKSITFWQAAGLLVLSRILFGSWGGRRHGYTECGNFGPRAGMREKMMQMTEGERNEFREKWRNRMHERGHGPAAE